MIGSCHDDVVLRVEWVPYHLRDCVVLAALETKGTVHEVKRDTCSAKGFQSIEFTTRLVRIAVKEAVTGELLSDHLRFSGSNALALIRVPPPLCFQ